MLDTILGATAPAFFVMGLGWIAGRTRDLDNRRVSELNALVMDFSLPAALFVAVAQTPRTVLAEQGSLVLVLAASMLGIYAVVFALERRLFGRGAPEAAVQALTVALPNFASGGLPLISSVFGAGHAAAVGVSIATASILLSPLTLIVLESAVRKDGGTAAPPNLLRSLGAAFLKPVVVAPIVGVALSLAGAETPKLLADSLNLIGVGAGGTALFLTGLILSSQKFRWNASVASGTLLKNIALPLAAALLATSFAAPPLVCRESILLSAVPSGFFGILFGLRYGVAPPDAGSTLVASTLLSAATLPLAILWVSS